MKAETVKHKRAELDIKEAMSVADSERNRDLHKLAPRHSILVWLCTAAATFAS